MARRGTAAPGISPIHQSGNGIKARFPITLCGNGLGPPSRPRRSRRGLYLAQEEEGAAEKTGGVG